MKTIGMLLLGMFALATALGLGAFLSCATPGGLPPIPPAPCDPSAVAPCQPPPIPCDLTQPGPCSPFGAHARDGGGQ